MKFLEQHRIFQYQNILLYIIAFLFPVAPKVVPVFLVAFGLLSIANIGLGYRRAQIGDVSVVMVVLYMLHLLGMLYTDNTSRGLFDLEVKLSLAAIPILFVGFKFLNTTNFRRVLLAFASGAIVSATYCVLQSAYKVFWLDMPTYHFVTSRFSVIMHQSYFALYMNFTILIWLFLHWPFRAPTWKDILKHTFILGLLSASVILSGSKIELITWVLIVVTSVSMALKVAQNKLIPIIIMVAMVTTCAVMISTNAELKARMMNVLKIVQSDPVKPESVESTAVRMLVYDSCWEIIKEQPWYGQGTGDFQDALDRKYVEKGYSGAIELHLNAHNLFFQSIISLGYHGLMTVIGLFILLLYHSLRQRDYLMLGFCLAFLLISLTESTMNVQAGVVFFSFFAVIFGRKSMGGNLESEVSD